MGRDFKQLKWDTALARDCRQLVKLALREDLGRGQDWTTVALVAPDAIGKAALAARRPGVIAGLPAAQMTLEQVDSQIRWSPLVEDGATVLEAPKLIKNGEGFSDVAIAAGVAAGVVAFATTAILMRWFRGHDARGFDPFALYCAVAGAGALTWLALHH